MSDLQLHWVEDENSESGYYDENTLVNKPTTRYYYDGQMKVEEDFRTLTGEEPGPKWSVTRYGLGTGFQCQFLRTSSPRPMIHPNFPNPTLTNRLAAIYP